MDAQIHLCILCAECRSQRFIESAACVSEWRARSLTGSLFRITDRHQPTCEHCLPYRPHGGLDVISQDIFCNRALLVGLCGMRWPLETVLWVTKPPTSNVPPLWYRKDDRDGRAEGISALDKASMLWTAGMPTLSRRPIYKTRRKLRYP